MVKDSPVISISNVLTGYRKSGVKNAVAAFRGLDFFAGDFVAVVGSNGVGKSTLLRTICGLLPPLEGEVILDGKRLRDITAAELSTKIAIVLTQRVGGFNLKVRDAVAAGQMPYTDAFHRMRPQNWSVVQEMLGRCGIADAGNLLLNELSDGMFQKTMIARALAQQTGALLLDEPSAYLDYASKHQLFMLLGELAQSANKCVLISTHELDLALRYCSRMLVMGAEGSRLLTVEDAKNDAAFMKMTGGYL